MMLTVGTKAPGVIGRMFGPLTSLLRLQGIVLIWPHLGIVGLPPGLWWRHARLNGSDGNYLSLVKIAALTVVILLAVLLWLYFLKPLFVGPSVGFP